MKEKIWRKRQELFRLSICTKDLSFENYISATMFFRKKLSNCNKKLKAYLKRLLGKIIFMISNPLSKKIIYLLLLSFEKLIDISFIEFRIFLMQQNFFSLYMKQLF